VRPHAAILAAAAAALVLSAAVGPALARRVRTFLRRLALGFAILASPRRYVREVVPWQAISWGFRVLSVVFFLAAFGLEASAANALRVQAAETLAAVVPLTPGGLGAEQALAVYTLRGTAPLGAVLGFAIGMKLVLVAANVAAAALAIGLALRTLRWRRHLRRARTRVRIEGAGGASSAAPPARGGGGSVSSAAVGRVARRAVGDVR
jgi:uncharacterized membrane protein YbhN (UPF0104 family)